MFDTKKENKIQIASERNFGFTFSIIFFIISFYPLLLDRSISLFFLFISLMFLFLSFFFTKLLVIPNKIWFKFGLFLNSFMSPLIMGIIFFFTVVPTGLIMKILNKDLLDKKFNKSKDTYWKKKEYKSPSMKNQF